jgi:hypothetical protein
MVRNTLAEKLCVRECSQHSEHSVLCVSECSRHSEHSLLGDIAIAILPIPNSSSISPFKVSMNEILCVFLPIVMNYGGLTFLISLS